MKKSEIRLKSEIYIPNDKYTGVNSSEYRAKSITHLPNAFLGSDANLISWVI